MVREKMIKTLLNEFITNNDLDFSGEGSDLNGNCVILAGYLCYLLDERGLDAGHGDDAIGQLSLTSDAQRELNRVFAYAYISSYERWWKSADAKAKYKF
jgi:hypothetical protein